MEEGMEVWEEWEDMVAECMEEECMVWEEVWEECMEEVCMVKEI